MGAWGNAGEIFVVNEARQFDEVAAGARYGALQHFKEYIDGVRKLEKGTSAGVQADGVDEVVVRGTTRIRAVVVRALKFFRLA